MRPGEMVSLNSSNLVGAGYDAATKTLTIEFVSGGTYRYQGVPQEVYSGLIHAPSAGSYFARQIKGIYPYTRA